MEEFIFADGEDICVYADGEAKKYKSGYIESYKRNSAEAERAKAWKYSGEGAQFRGDIRAGAEVKCSINGVYLDRDAAVYSFSVNNLSGIYCRSLADEKAAESHVINSLEHEYSGGCLDLTSGRLAVSAKRGYLDADIALFDIHNGNYVTVTGGDSLDEDPFFDPENANIIYFSSRGAGRDAGGNFVAFSPAEILRLNLSTSEMSEIISDAKYSYYKPIKHGGKLYAIKAPAGEKKPNPVLSALLLPVRFLEAVANLISVFIRAFTGKSTTSGGANPAKGREYDSRKIYVRGNLINAEKESKKNTGKRKGEGGMIPRSWKLVELGGAILAEGVADFDICADGTVIYTDGKHIYALENGKKRKLCNTDCCLRLAVAHGCAKSYGLFDF